MHQNFPGQFRHIAPHLQSLGHRVIGIGNHPAPGLNGIDMLRYKLTREPTQGLHRYVRTLENGVIYGQATAQKMLKLKQQGFVPDVILAHPGWGEALYLQRHGWQYLQLTPALFPEPAIHTAAYWVLEHRLTSESSHSVTELHRQPHPVFPTSNSSYPRNPNSTV